MANLQLLATVAEAVAWKATGVEDKIRKEKREECARVMKARKMVDAGQVAYKAVQVEHELFYASESEAVYRMHEGDEMRMFFVINLTLREIYENPLSFKLQTAAFDWGGGKGGAASVEVARESVRARVWEMLNVGVFDLRPVAKEASLFIETHLFKDAKCRKDFCNRLTLERRVQRVVDQYPEDFKRLRGQATPPTTPPTRKIKWEWEKGNPTAPGGGGGGRRVLFGRVE